MTPAMAERDDDAEHIRSKPPPLPPRDENIQPTKQRPATPPDEWVEENRPRRRRRPDVRRDDDDGVSTIIPYKNGLALAGYYVGVFSLIPIVGFILGPLGLIFGIVGLRRVNRNPEIKGTGHAVTAIVLGGLSSLVHFGLLAVIVIGGIMAGRR